MEILLLSIASFLVAILTFFSGFGLGTILTPLFIIFFPVETAIALCGIVHFANNIFKIILVGKKADVGVLLRFGIPAVIFAFLGSWLLINLSSMASLYSYQVFGKTFEVSLIKFIIAILLILFACIDLIPYFNKLEFGKNKLPIGGALSGFFGGLSGNQGALRSAFLIRVGLTKEAFIGTAVVVSTFVDLARLSIYATRFTNAGMAESFPLITSAALSAIAGAYIGNKLLKKVTLKFLQIIVAVLLVMLSIALGTGLL